jgi:hypothetical protein
MIVGDFIGIGIGIRLRLRSELLKIDMGVFPCCRIPNDLLDKRPWIPIFEFRFQTQSLKSNAVL